MLVFYQMKNLIDCYFKILQYYLCFEVEQDKKLVLPKANTQQYKLTSQNPKQSQTDQPGNIFLVRRQKYCNFCGHVQQKSTKVQFIKKCHNCCMKNSCLVLPAHFLCNTCLDHNKKSIHASKFACFRKEQLDKFGNSMQND